MDFPTVKLKSGDTIFQVDEKVERAFEEAGLSLVAFDGLNAFLDISSFCHFFQVPHETDPGVIVVISEPWEERTLIQVLNVLLEMRMDPDPPGSQLRFHFYSPHEVPKVLPSIFGSTACCLFESRALLVARFGHDLTPSHGKQLGALAAFLLRDCFRLSVGFFDADGVRPLEDVLLDRFLKDGECVEPVNSLMALGCLYGEVLRSRVPHSVSWAAHPECDPWPGLLFENSHGPDAEDPSRVVFNPIAQVVQFFKTPERGALVRAGAEFQERCRALLGKPADGTAKGAEGAVPANGADPGETAP